MVVELSELYDNPGLVTALKVKVVNETQAQYGVFNKPPKEEMDKFGRSVDASANDLVERLGRVGEVFGTVQEYYTEFVQPHIDKPVNTSELPKTQLAEADLDIISSAFRRASRKLLGKKTSRTNVKSESARDELISLQNESVEASIMVGETGVLTELAKLAQEFAEAEPSDQLSSTRVVVRTVEAMLTKMMEQDGVQRESSLDYAESWVNELKWQQEQEMKALNGSESSTVLYDANTLNANFKEAMLGILKLSTDRNNFVASDDEVANFQLAALLDLHDGVHLLVNRVDGLGASVNAAWVLRTGYRMNDMIVAWHKARRAGDGSS
ncbi:hypothetical protein KBD69_02350 [Candidatus Woesebacteria bacterium]|nr:hypothetical protein [Candidatus Woesebacteria bacterium]